jgi:CubicO group peptidase (beta-lactamase class C family)
VLKAVLERVSGKDNTSYGREKIWQPIGDTASVFQERTGMPFSGWRASTRDMARFGLLVLHQGDWKGRPAIKDKSYLQAALSTSQDLNQSYGYLWWLNGKKSYVLPGRGRSGSGPMIPSAPPDVVAALGAGDKKIYVCPSLDLVVTRHGAPAGMQAEALSTFDSEIWTRLMQVVKA